MSLFLFSREKEKLTETKKAKNWGEVKIKTAVIGAGAAGLFAAGEAAACGADVTLFEKNGRLGKKIVITGKGRCNLTNLCDVREFLSNVAVNSKFLYSAINFFTPEDTYKFFTDLGTELKVERGRRVFPVSDKSFDVVDALKKFITKNGVKVSFEKVVDIISENQTVQGVKTENGFYKFDAVIICTGGLSYPGTGSDGDGYNFAEKLGHTIKPLKPSLVPIEIKEGFCTELMGLSLKNIKTALYENDKNIYAEEGEMLFTHFGISGPVILSISSHIRNLNKNNYSISIDFKPALSYEMLDKRILSDFSLNINKNFNNALSDLLPVKIIPVFVKLSGIDPYKKVNEITKKERSVLVGLFKDFKLSVKKLRPIEEAIITSGGIDTNEIIPNRMESKIVKNLYFAGEIIDVDAYTGGYNLQIAFSTGKLAGNRSSLKF